MKRPLTTLALLMVMGAAIGIAAGTTVGGGSNMVEWVIIGVGTGVIVWSVWLIVSLSAAKGKSREDGP